MLVENQRDLFHFVLGRQLGELKLSNDGLFTPLKP